MTGHDSLGNVEGRFRKKCRRYFQFKVEVDKEKAYYVNYLGICAATRISDCTVQGCMVMYGHIELLRSRSAGKRCKLASNTFRHDSRGLPLQILSNTPFVIYSSFIKVKDSRKTAFVIIFHLF